MEENPSNENEQAATALVPVESADEPAMNRRWLIGAGVILAVFLAGFVPMWLKAGRNASERNAAVQQVKLLRLETLAAAAAVDARRGEYEAARQSASQFFTELSGELDLGPRSSLTTRQMNELAPLLALRDDLITLLARSDPACAERLTGVYVTCRSSVRPLDAAP